MDEYGTFAELAGREVDGRDYRVRVRDKSAWWAIVAPHGGGIEWGTSQIADAVAGSDLSSPASAEPSRHPAPPTRSLDRLIALQRANGSWPLTDELARALGWPDAKSLRKALGRGLAGDREERAASTALALAWL